MVHFNTTYRAHYASPLAVETFPRKSSHGTLASQGIFPAKRSLSTHEIPKAPKVYTKIPFPHHKQDSQDLTTSPSDPFLEIHNRCLLEVQNLRSDSDTRSVQDLLKIIAPAKNKTAIREELVEIEKLQKALTDLKAQAESICSSHTAFKEALEEQFVGFQKLLKTTLFSNDYLTDGPGQFEEYERSNLENKEMLSDCLSAFELSIEDLKKSFPKIARCIQKQASEFKRESLSKLSQIISLDRKDHECVIKECDELTSQCRSFQDRLGKELEKIARLEGRTKQKQESLSYSVSDGLAPILEMISETRRCHQFSTYLEMQTIYQAIDDYDCDAQEILNEYTQDLHDLEEIFNRIREEILGSSQETYMNPRRLLEITLRLERTLNTLLSALDEKIDTSVDEDLPSQMLEKVRDRVEKFCHEFYPLREFWTEERIKTLETVLLTSQKLATFDREKLLLEQELVKRLKGCQKVLPDMQDSLKEILTQVPPLSEQIASQESTRLRENIALLLKLVRKERLHSVQNESSLTKLRDLRRQAELQVKEEVKNHKDPLDQFITWTRLHETIVKLEKEEEERGKRIVQEFVSTVKRDSLIAGGNKTCVLYKKTDHMSHVVWYPAVRRHPLDSSLIEAVSFVARQGIGVSQFTGILHLSSAPLTSFEEGFLKIFNVGKKMATSHHFDQAAKEGSSTGIDLPSPLSRGGNSYTALKIPPLDVRAKKIEFSKEVEACYSLLAMTLAYRLKDGHSRLARNLGEGHPVACVIVSSAGEILSWGVNTIGSNPKDPVRHAEINALSAYFERNTNARKLPQGSRVFTSLKPCFMCAGGIHDSLAPVDLQARTVLYAQTDPSQNNTALQNYEEQAPIPDLVKVLDETYASNKNGNAAESWLQEFMQGAIAPIPNRLQAALEAVDPVIAERINAFLKEIF